jgi:hypothetical protein
MTLAGARAAARQVCSSRTQRVSLGERPKRCAFRLWARALLIVATLLMSAAARAQVAQAVPESALREPWVQQLAVVDSLSGAIAAPGDAAARARMTDALTYVQVAIGEYESQVDQVIDRIVGDPQFAYVAAETSQALGAQLAEVHARFDALYAALGVRERADVRAAQGSLDALRKLLQDTSRFEQDVVVVFASASREQIVGLATRWWNGEERAIAVKKRVAELRLELELPDEGR